MARYQFTATRSADGADIYSGTLEDVLNAGEEAMKLTVMFGLLHSRQLAKGLVYNDIEIEMTLVEGAGA